MQGLPNLLLTKIAVDLFLAGESQSSGQSFVADELCDCFSERSYIAYGEKKPGFAIHDDVHDASRLCPYHRFASRLRLEDHCGQPFSVAWQDYGIGNRVVRSRLLYRPCENHA